MQIYGDTMLHDYNYTYLVFLLNAYISLMAGVQTTTIKIPYYSTIDKMCKVMHIW